MRKFGRYALATFKEPIPWFNYRHMTDEDLNAVFAYIHTLKPIHNQVPTPLPPGNAPKTNSKTTNNTKGEQS